VLNSKVFVMPLRGQVIEVFNGNKIDAIYNNLLELSHCSLKVAKLTPPSPSVSGIYFKAYDIAETHKL
jgi:hypothetical protein